MVTRRRAAAEPFTHAALAIVAVGAALRLYTILGFAWDQDELYTVEEARDLFHTLVPPGIEARPLYYLLQHPLLAVLPHTPLMLRLLPLVFGVAGLWVTWLAGRRHVGPVGGLVAVFLASVSAWHMEASGQARYYSLVYLCTALVLLWLPEADDAQRPSAWLAVLAAMVCGTLTHPSFVFPVAGIVLGVALVRRDGTPRPPWPSPAAWRWLWGPFGTFLLLFVAALRVTHHEGAVRNSVGRGMAATLRLLPAMVEWMTPVVGGAALVATVCLARSRAPGHRRLAAIALLSAAITAGALFLSSFWTAIYATYATGLLVVAFVTAGALAQQVADALARDAAAPGAGHAAAQATGRPVRASGPVAAAAIALFGFAVAPSTLSHLSDGTRFDYRPAYRQIEREAPGRPVVTWPAVLAEAYAPGLQRLPLRPEASYLDSLLARHGDLWVVASVKRAGIALDDRGELEGWLALRCRRRGVTERPRFDYRLYRVELFRCGGGAAAGSRAGTVASRAR